MKRQMTGYLVDKPPPPTASPKGWKINEILPAYSPPLTGGGISDAWISKDLTREEGMAPEPVPPQKRGGRSNDQATRNNNNFMKAVQRVVLLIYSPFHQNLSHFTIDNGNLF